MSAATTATTLAPDGTDRSRILTAGLVAVGGSVAANIVLRLLLGLVLPLDPAFVPFGLGPIAFFTAFYTVGAVILFWLLARFTRRPARLFTIVAVVAFIVTLGPNLGGAANPAAMPFPGTATDFLTLILFHIPPFLVTVWALTRMTRAA